MSVPVGNRTESKMEFITNFIDLCLFVLNKYTTKPTRYKFYYRDFILNPIMQAMYDAKCANSINIKIYEDFVTRRKYLLSAYCKLQAVLSQIDIYYNVYKNQGMSKHELDNLLELISKELNLLGGVIKSDLKVNVKIIDDYNDRKTEKFILNKYEQPIN